MNQIIRWMVGRDLPEPKIRNVEKGALALKVSNDTKGTAVRDVSFELHRGEILGFAGLMGSGRTETMRASFGADRMEGGSVIVQYNKQRQGLINK